MAFLARDDTDLSRPRKRDAARDAVVRAALPAVGLWLVIVAVGWLLVDGPLRPLAEAEEQVNESLAAGRTGTWNTVSEWFSLIGATPTIIGVAVVVALGVWWATRRWWLAVVPLLAILLQSIVFVTSAAVVGRDRPPVSKLDDSPPTASFPSGHESATTALYVSFLLLSLRVRNPALRWALVALCALMPALVFYGRLYRGMHHVTDLLAGITNGVCALLAWNYLRRDTTSTPEAQARHRRTSSGDAPQTRA